MAFTHETKAAAKLESTSSGRRHERHTEIIGIAVAVFV
jgi:hypothetical protein